MGLLASLKKFSAIGVSPSGKARDFDSRTRRFESYHPSQLCWRIRQGVYCALHPNNTGCPMFTRQMSLVDSNTLLFAGNSNPRLAQAVASYLGTPLGRCSISRFSDGEILADIEENVRGRDIFLIQSTCAPTNDNLMELLVMTDALKRASAGHVTAVIPYFGYARQDRRVRSARVPITAKVVANLLMAVGIDHVLTVDLHADQIQGFFDIPVDNVYAAPILLGDIWLRKRDDLIVVSPDVGGVVRARALAKRLDDVDLAIIDKRRPKANEAQVMHIIGSVEGKFCVLLDDMVDTAGTLCLAAQALKERGASQVVAYATHPVLSGPAVERITGSVLDELVITDTIPLNDQASACPKIRQLSVAHLLGETIRRMAADESVSSIYVD